MCAKGIPCAALTLLIMASISSCAQPPSDPAIETKPLEEEQTSPPASPDDPTPTPLPVHTERDIEYVPGGGAYQSLDVYLPPGSGGQFPTILAIHGGAFRARSKAIYNFLGKHMAAEGIAFVSTNYRLTQKASYPAQVEDVFCALAWIHANHEVYGFDPQQVFVWGGSAGGYLAGMVGTVDTPEIYLTGCPYELPDREWLQGMILFYGFYDFTNPETIGDFPFREVNLEPYWGASYENLSREVLEEMSPLAWVDGSEPPALILHGTRDTEIPSEMSEVFAAALEDAGIPVELILIDAKHAFELQPLDGPEMTLALAAVEAFLSNPSGR